MQRMESLGLGGDSQDAKCYRLSQVHDWFVECAVRTKK